MATDFGAMIKGLEQMGFYDVILPFLLVFAIIFAMLQKVKLFGKDQKNINVVVALVTAFFVVRVPEIVEAMNSFLPKISFLVLVLLMVLLVLGIFGASAEGMTGGWFFIAIVIAVAGIIWAITSSIPGLSLPDWLSINAENQGVLLGIGALILGLYLLTKEKPKQPKKWGEWFKEEFSPGKLRGGGQ